MKKDVRRTAAAMAAVLILGGQNPQILLAAGWEGADSLDRAPEQETLYVEESYVNPLYADIIEPEDLKKPEEIPGSGISTLTEPVYADTVEEAGAQIREGMRLRSETIQVYYEAPEYVEGIAREIAEAGLEHTGVPDEGDYLRWQYGGWNAEGQAVSSPETGMYYITLTYTYTYYTNYEQEQTVDQRVSEVLDELDVYAGTDYEKLEAIYSFICGNTAYDYDNLNNPDYKLQYTAYGALVDKKSVCQGYALLFYRLALELGVDSRMISGEGGGEPHGWNIAEIGGLYYNVDSTWDAGDTEYQYFLKGSENFGDHIADASYTTEEFIAGYPISAADYVSEVVQVATPSITSVFSRLQTTAKVTWTAAEGADGYELYRAEKQDAAEEDWALTKTIRTGDTVQYTNSGLTLGLTYYYKVRAYALTDSGEKVYSDFSNISYMPATVIFNGPYSNSTQRIRLIWNPVQGAHGYQIWRLDAADGTWKIVKTLGDKGNTLIDDQGAASVYSNTGLNSGEAYTYKMRAFSIFDGQKVFSAYSDEITVKVMPEAPELTVTGSKAGRVEIRWNAVNGADGYQIWRALFGSNEFKVAKTISEGDVESYTNIGLVSGNTYQYRIRAYVINDVEKTFGGYSEVKTITVK